MKRRKPEPDLYADDRMPDDLRWTAKGLDLYAGGIKVATFERGRADLAKWIAKVVDAVEPQKRGAMRVIAAGDQSAAMIAAYNAQCPHAQIKIGDKS